MKLLIAGSRTIPADNLKLISDIICDHPWFFNESIIEIVSGKALGADRLGENWAKKYHIPIKYFPANWNKYGKSAGHIRNKEMAEYCDKGIIIVDSNLMEKSKGSMNMIKNMENNKPYIIIYFDPTYKEKNTTIRIGKI